MLEELLRWQYFTNFFRFKQDQNLKKGQMDLNHLLLQVCASCYIAVIFELLCRQTGKLK